MSDECFDGGFPSVVPEIFQTAKGVRYLKSPGVVVIAKPNVQINGIKGFLDGFPTSLGYDDYLKDPDSLTPAETLTKAAGQICYMSFGKERTKNVDAAKYFENIMSSSHGSVLEHANFSVLLWGISRSLTHELVRHRAGFGFSQVSQRYVGGKSLRFVERPEFQSDEYLHKWFEKRIEKAAREYEKLTNYLFQKQKSGEEILSAERKTDLRKKVRQAARALLPNETEAPIVVLANVRAWRHFFNMRVSVHAEVEIRRVGFEIYRCLYSLAPHLFNDFVLDHLPDGTHGLKTIYPKV